MSILVIIESIETKFKGESNELFKLAIFIEFKLTINVEQIPFVRESARLPGLKSPAKVGLFNCVQGELAERPNAPVSKTGGPKGSGGSNPSLSARLNVEVLRDVVKLVDTLS